MLQRGLLQKGKPVRRLRGCCAEIYYCFECIAACSAKPAHPPRLRGGVRCAHLPRFGAQALLAQLNGPLIAARFELIVEGVRRGELCFCQECRQDPIKLETGAARAAENPVFVIQVVRAAFAAIFVMGSQLPSSDELKTWLVVGRSGIRSRRLVLWLAGFGDGFFGDGFLVAVAIRSGPARDEKRH